MYLNKAVYVNIYKRMFNGLRSEVIVCFIDIGGIVDHH